MKKYRVTVNGTVYEVELEELTGSAPVSAPAAPAAAPAPAASAAPAAGEQICAPMPGNILAVNVTAGQAVKKGDVLMVLEAMKMENEMRTTSPRSWKPTKSSSRTSPSLRRTCCLWPCSPRWPPSS